MTTTLTTIKIAASNSSVDDRTHWADIVCGATNAQNDINAAMSTDNIRLLFPNTLCQHRLAGPYPQWLCAGGGERRRRFL